MTKKREARRRVEKNWLEWAVFGLGLALVGATLGFLIYEGATGDAAAPPAVEVKLGEPRPTGHNFIVPVTVTNHGGQTAEGVTVEVTLEGAGGEPERGELTVAFLPRGATREGWVAFRTDPRGGRLTPRVLGFEKP